MKDQNGIPLVVGDRVAYAVREGSCGAALRVGTVTALSPSTAQVDVMFHRWDGTQYFRKVWITKPSRVVVTR